MTLKNKTRSPYPPGQSRILQVWVGVKLLSCYTEVGEELYQLH